MIKVNGIEIENCPKNVKNLDNLIMGELHSEAMHNLKTPVNVYANNIPEIMEYANKIKNLDPLFDTIYIYDVVDDDNREFLFEQSLND